MGKACGKWQFSASVLAHSAADSVQAPTVHAQQLSNIQPVRMAASTGQPVFWCARNYDGSTDWEVNVSTPAILALEDGTLFHGLSVGAEGETVGEVVFNTAMTGYQEILTDPSYARQIVTLTYPHIGNTGTNAEDEESAGVMAAGLVIRDLPLWPAITAVSSLWATI